MAKLIHEETEGTIKFTYCSVSKAKIQGQNCVEFCLMGLGSFLQTSDACIWWLSVVFLDSL